MCVSDCCKANVYKKVKVSKRFLKEQCSWPFSISAIFLVLHLFNSCFSVEVLFSFYLLSDLYITNTVFAALVSLTHLKTPEQLRFCLRVAANANKYNTSSTGVIFITQRSYIV